MTFYSEVYHGKRWNEDPRFQAPMIEVEGTAFHVNEFIVFQHNQYGRTNGKILKFFNRVSYYMYLYVYILV